MSKSKKPASSTEAIDQVIAFLESASKDFDSAIFMRGVVRWHNKTKERDKLLQERERLQEELDRVTGALCK